MIRYGPTTPPTRPSELISAMPAATCTRRSTVGMAKKSSSQVSTPNPVSDSGDQGGRWPRPRVTEARATS